MSARVVGISVISAALLVLCRPAAAQMDAVEGGAGPQFVVSTRASMPQGNPSIPTSGTGGTAGGFLGSIGGFPSRLVGVALEFSVPLSFTDEQHADRFSARHRHRDLLLSGLLQVRSAPEHRAQLAAVGGVSLVREDTQTAFAFDDPLTGLPQEAEFGDTTHRWTMAATFGADLRFVIAPHVLLVPVFRVDAIRRDDQNATFVGLGMWTYRSGVMLRGSF